MTFAKGLRCNGKAGVNTTLNAVLELYAGKRPSEAVLDANCNLEGE